MLLASRPTGSVADRRPEPGSPQDIARLLFHDFLLPFEVTSVLILIAIMGAVVLASRPEAVAIAGSRSTRHRMPQCDWKER